MTKLFDHCVVQPHVPHSGQNLHQLDWQSLHEPNQRNAVSFQYNRFGAERPLTQTSFSLSADGLSCALPRVPHFSVGGMGFMQMLLVWGLSIR
jgi:hypothetical protein